MATAVVRIGSGQGNLMSLKSCQIAKQLRARAPSTTAITWYGQYRYQVLTGELRLRVRESIRQVCDELGVEIVKGALSRDHVHMVIAVPPHRAISDVTRRIQQEFPAIRKRYWGCHFWARGYVSTTSGNITDDVILQYLENHLTKPTGVSR